MKSKIESIKTKNKELPFPKLMKSNCTKNFVVLFAGPGSGTVVHLGDHRSYKLGYLSKSWSMDSFRDYEGKVILRN